MGVGWLLGLLEKRVCSNDVQKHASFQHAAARPRLRRRKKRQRGHPAEDRPVTATPASFPIVLFVFFPFFPIFPADTIQFLSAFLASPRFTSFLLLLECTYIHTYILVYARVSCSEPLSLSLSPRLAPSPRSPLFLFLVPRYFLKPVRSSVPFVKVTVVRDSVHDPVYWNQMDQMLGPGCHSVVFVNVENARDMALTCILYYC